MLFLKKNINQVKQTENTKTIIYQLYNDIFNSFKYLNTLKKTKKYFQMSSKKIVSASQITKPSKINLKSFPDTIIKHIDKYSISEIMYQFSLFKRNIKVYFVLEESDIKIEILNNYIDAIIMWLYIITKYSSKQCGESVIIYLYLTSLKKKLPESNKYVLNEINVNTAFTFTCQKDSEIIIFRKEEWFKVLIHESFHNFGLDFSDMNNTDSHKYILNIFKVNSLVNLYESYTEFWAEIINALFCSFFSLKDKTNFYEFLSFSNFFINFEITFSFVQLFKTLDFMCLSYKDLYSNSLNSLILREKFKEKTNVLSYYIIKTILINNYQSFLYWCKTNNSSLLQFNKTVLSQKNFCKFIEKNYKSKSMLESINKTELFIKEIKEKQKSENLKYFLLNLRMSICELE